MIISIVIIARITLYHDYSGQCPSNHSAREPYLVIPHKKHKPMKNGGGNNWTLLHTKTSEPIITKFCTLISALWIPTIMQTFVPIPYWFFSPYIGLREVANSPVWPLFRFLVPCRLQPSASMDFDTRFCTKMCLISKATSQYSTVVLTVVRVMIAKYRK